MREAAIDTSLTHYLEERALAIALAKSHDPDMLGKLERLAGLRETLMRRRAATVRLLVERRHARGEFYSDAKVSSINGLGPSREELEKSVRELYEAQPHAEGVLKAHARVHFGQGLVSQRSQMPLMTADIADIARDALAQEEAFATAWCDAIADPAFRAELARCQREALKLLRNAATPMVLVCMPPCAAAGQVDAGVLGRAWNKLDAACTARDLPPLSLFIGIEGQAAGDGVAAGELQPSIEFLLGALEDGSLKVSPKKAVQDALVQVREALLQAVELRGRAYFEVDF